MNWFKNLFKNDPIVTRPVRGGFIVITAWDKEAEIPEIINHLNN